MPDLSSDATYRPADPIVFGPEYAPSADPLSYRAAPPDILRNEWAAALWAYRAQSQRVGAASA